MAAAERRRGALHTGVSAVLPVYRAGSLSAGRRGQGIWHVTWVWINGCGGVWTATLFMSSYYATVIVRLPQLDGPVDPCNSGTNVGVTPVPEPSPARAPVPSR